jgi:DNA-binding LacI/PurR family transcriptional regulator
MDDLPWSRFSAVAIGPSLLHPCLHSACNNHYHAMLLTLKQLHRHGYRRVGLVLDPRVDERHQQKYQAAFWHHTRRLGLPAINPLLTSEYEVAEFRRWWRREKPDAVLSDDEAVLAKLERMQLNAPRDLGFACLSLDTRPGVAGVDTAPESIAGFAVERLAAMLVCGETGIPEVPTSTMLNGLWVEGRTLRSVPADPDLVG